MCDQQSANATIDFANIPCAELYQMCVAGEEPAWRYIYNYTLKIVRLQGTVYPDTPEDVAQEISMRLMARGLDAIQNPGAFRAYVRMMIRNYFIDQLRRTRPHTESISGSDEDDSGPPEPQSPGPGPDAISQGKTLLKLFQSQMEKLSRQCGKILKVYFNYKLNGKPKNYKEMADRFGLSVGGTGVRIKRCLEELCAFPSIRNWMDDVLST